MLNDVRFACRQLLRSPGFAAAAIGSLALGIGATITVIAWMRHIWLRPYAGVPRQEQLVVLRSSQGSGNVSLPDVDDLRKLDTVFAGIVLWQTSSAALLEGGQTSWVNAQVVSADFFDVLGVRPLLGRAFLPGEDRMPGGNPVVVISERLWRGRFGADPAIVGRVLELNRVKFTVVGVAPAAFRGSNPASSFEVWAPLSMIWEMRNQRPMTERSARGWQDLARLRPGVTVAQAQAAVDGVGAGLAQAYPRTNREVRHRVLTIAQQAGDVGTMFVVLLVVSLGVLLVVAANVSNLLLARATNRRREIAIRLAAGASRGQLIRLLLVESLLLALPGGAAGVLLAAWAVDSITLFLPGPLAAGIFLDLSLDLPTVAAAALLTLGTGVAFGLVPALQASRPNLSEALKAGGGSVGGLPSHHRVRRTLVVVEMAVAVVLLIGAGLLIEGVRAARRIDIGFSPDRVLVAGLQIGMNGYDPTTGLAFYRDLRQRTAALPRVEAAALASWLPLGRRGCKGSGVEVDGYVRPPGEDTTYEFAIVSPGYFETLRIPLVAGREFTVADDATAPRVAVVNEHFAQRFWPGRDAVGQRFRCFGQWRTVIGVAKAGKYNRLDEPAWCFYYLPEQQGVPDLDLKLCVRAREDPAALANTLHLTLHEQNPHVEFTEVFPLRDYVQGALLVESMTSSLLALIGGTALVLATMGVYAVTAYTVSQRMREFGVRLALGAQSTDVLRQVVAEGLKLAALGSAAGVGVAGICTRLLGGFLHGVSPFDPAVFVTVPLVLGAAVVCACLAPAWRAGRADPLAALRAE